MSKTKLLGGIIGAQEAIVMMRHQRRMLANAMLEAYPMTKREVAKATGVACETMNKANNRTRTTWSRKVFFNTFPEVKAARSRHRAMLYRISNPNDKHYKDYGGRGIKVHQPWRESFWCWYEYVRGLPNHDIEGYSLDRIDNDGHYEPGNLRYATYSQQTSNQRPRAGKQNCGPCK